jgi:hypothetical protein
MAGLPSNWRGKFGNRSPCVRLREKSQALAHTNHFYVSDNGEKRDIEITFGSHNAKRFLDESLCRRFSVAV